MGEANHALGSRRGAPRTRRRRGPGRRPGAESRAGDLDVAARSGEHHGGLGEPVLHRLGGGAGGDTAHRNAGDGLPGAISTREAATSPRATTASGMPIHSQSRRFFGAGSAGAHSYDGGAGGGASDGVS